MAGIEINEELIFDLTSEYAQKYNTLPETNKQAIQWAYEQSRNKAIDEAIETSAKVICVGCGYLEGHECTYKGSNCSVSKPMLEAVIKALEQMKAGGKNE